MSGGSGGGTVEAILSRLGAPQQSAPVDYSRPLPARQPWDWGQGFPGQSPGGMYGQQGMLNTLTQDMSHGRMGGYGFTPFGGFNYSPYGMNPFASGSPGTTPPFDPNGGASPHGFAQYPGGKPPYEMQRQQQQMPPYSAYGGGRYQQPMHNPYGGQQMQQYSPYGGQQMQQYSPYGGQQMQQYSPYGGQRPGVFRPLGGSRWGQ